MQDNGRLQFFSDCVGWPRDDVHTEGGLCAMIDAATDITRATFLRHVDRDGMAEIERALGYAPHDRGSCLRMSADWAVSYHRSKLHDRRVYYFRQSAIEYVFTTDGGVE